MGLEYYAFAIFIAVLVCIVAIIFKVLFSNVKRANKMLDDRERQILETYNAVETIMEEFQDQAKATIDELNLREQEYRAAMMNIAAFQLPAELEKKEQAIERVPRSGAGGLDASRIKVAGEVLERAERLAAPQMPQPPKPAVSAAASPPVAYGGAALPSTPAAHSPYAPSPAVTQYIANEPVHAPINAAAPAYAVPPVPAPMPAVSPPPSNGVLTSASDAQPAVFQKFFDDASESPPPTPYAPTAVNGGSRRDAILALAKEGKSDVEIASNLGITRNEVQLVTRLISGR